MSDPHIDTPTGPPSAILTWSHCGAALISRRSQALADYWLALAQARQPEQAVALQVDYWTHMIDDYAAAANEAVSPFVQPIDESGRPPPHLA
jgi:hypothetical protein